MAHVNMGPRPTNHDRNAMPSILDKLERATASAAEKVTSNGTSTFTTPAVPVTNGIKEVVRTMDEPAAVSSSTEQQTAPGKELPPEVVHISDGYHSLSMLLVRLAQQTHHQLSKTILELAQMPLPNPMTNGSSAMAPPFDDMSAENVNKKVKLLKFAQAAHADWTKALVMNNWSRKAVDVSKLIDLKVHLAQREVVYQNAVHEMCMVKMSLNNARVPAPDVKTALEVLRTGKASWLPHLNYIPPRPLTDKEVLSTLDRLNTLLSIRLNLHDYSTIPAQLKDFQISSGRVTFKVPGEFALDLTIADEDPKSQFWFIDFRFDFSPALAEIPSRMLSMIESKVNLTLGTDGLAACCDFLHELVLTHKIGEYKRQALELAMGQWVEGLKIEQLNRSVSLHYWPDRHPRIPKSFVILGVHSGKQDTSGRGSRLSLRWFRDAKESADRIPLEHDHIDANRLLKCIVTRHANHILSITYDNLLTRPLFASQALAVSLHLSEAEGETSVLDVELTARSTLKITIDQVTGRILFSPASRLITDFQQRLNMTSMDPSNDIAQAIDNLRCLMEIEDIQMLGMSTGWTRVKAPNIRQEELKSLLPLSILHTAWYQRAGWNPKWFMVLCVGLTGEHWHLLEVWVDPSRDVQHQLTNNSVNVPVSMLSPSGWKISAHIPAPIKNHASIATYDFLSLLSVFGAGLLTQHANLRTLHERKIPYQLAPGDSAEAIVLPSILLRLSNIVMAQTSTAKGSWAQDLVRITFQGLERSARTPSDSEQPDAPVQESALVVSEALMTTPAPSVFHKLTHKIDPSVSFDEKSGCFAISLRSIVGDSVIPRLIDRLHQVSRLIAFIAVLQQHEACLTCTSISLSRIGFSYDMPGTRLHRYTASVEFDSADAPIRLALVRGNPHIRILDILRRLLNSTSGPSLASIASSLPTTLPVLRAVDAIEASWTNDELASRGEVIVLVRSIDVYNIRYLLHRPAADPSQPVRSVKVSFQVKLGDRRGRSFWMVRRQAGDGRGADDLDALLSQRIWNVVGEEWNGMRNAAVGADDGAEKMLLAIDATVRHAVAQGAALRIEEGRRVGQGPANPPHVNQVGPAGGPANGGAPVLVHTQGQVSAIQHQQQQQQQQHPRGMKREREFVEID